MFKKLNNKLATLSISLAVTFFVGVVVYYNNSVNKILTYIPPSISQVSQVSSSLSNGLVAHYTFDDDSATDMSGNGNNGSLNGQDLSFVSGKFGKALSFNGSNNYVKVSSNLGISNYPYTLSAWVKSSSNDGVALWYGNSKSNSRYSRVNISDGVYGIRIKQGSSEVIKLSPIPSDDSWHLVVGIFHSDTERELIVDGISYGVDTKNIDYLGSDSLIIGRHDGISPGSYFSGFIDDVRIYNRSILPSEIVDLINRDTGADDEGPVDDDLPVSDLSVGDSIRVISPINVRTQPIISSNTLKGSNPTGTLGTIVGGPTVTEDPNIADKTITWWNIDYDTGYDGWSGEDLIEVYTDSGQSPDTTPPIISSINTSNVTYSSISISWNTDESSTSLVEYGLTNAYGSNSNLVSTLSKNHSISLSSLNSNTSYHYRVVSTDGSGNITRSSNRIFTTSQAEEDPVVSSILCSSASQFGITWFFDKNYTCGQFANGDWWVVGPVKITKITPETTSGMHGSMINPRVNTNQGFDSRMKGVSYESSKNVALNMPLVVQPDSSLMSSESLISKSGGDNPQLKTIAILTVIDSPAPAGSFRPPYQGSDKTLRWNKNQLDYSKLRSLAPVSSTPSLSGVEKNFERPWIEYRTSYVGRYTHPKDNMPAYGREMAHELADGLLSLQLNYSNSQKEKLLINMTQIGIDIYGMARIGGGWTNDGGHNYGRKMPMLLAGVVLGDSDILWYADGDRHGESNNGEIFQEDQQTFYVTQSDVNRTHKLVVSSWPRVIEYTSSDIGTPEWGFKHATQPEYDSKNWDAQYRGMFPSVLGHALTAILMGVTDEWDSPAFFDYADRYYSIDKGNVSNTPNDIHYFVSNMWKAYRAGGSDIPTTNILNGQCGLIVNTCNVGTLNDISDSSTQYLWQCNGSNGGSTASCAISSSSEEPTSDFSINDRIRVISPINVRTQPIISSNTLKGSNPTGTLGTIVGGPTVTEDPNIAGKTITWWNINFDTGYDGWSGEDLFDKSSTPPLVVDTTAPAISVGDLSPSEQQGSIGLNITTNESATCKWSKTANVTYQSMSNTLTTSNSISHSALITSLNQGDNLVHIKCIDGKGNANIYDVSVTISYIESPFSINDRIRVISTINVRTEPLLSSNTLKGSNPTGTLGTIVGGPTVTEDPNIAGKTITWWNINFDTGYDGWSGEDLIDTYDTTDTPSSNNPPVISPIGTKSVNENSTLTFTVSASDSDGDTLVYDAVSLPSGSTFNTNTKTFSWKPTYSQSGTYNPVFRVTDGIDEDSKTAVINVVNVNRSPTANAGNDQSIVLPNSSVTLSGSSSFDPDGQTLTYSWSKVSGPTASISNSNSANISLLLNNSGTYTFRLTVSDGSLSSSDDVSVVVLPEVIVADSLDSDSDGIPNSEDNCANTASGVKVNKYGCPLPRTDKFSKKTDLSHVNITSVSTYELGNQYGEIVWNGPTLKLIDDSSNPLDIDSNLDIGDSTVSLNSSSLPELNKEATITLYNIDLEDPQILRDGSECLDCEILSYQDGVLVFTVSGFSTYTIVDKPKVDQSTPDTSDKFISGGGGGGNAKSHTATISSVVQVPEPVGVGNNGQTNVQSAGQIPPQYLSLTPFSRSPLVKELQILLNQLGFTVSETRGGSPGLETDYFGIKTLTALNRYKASLNNTTSSGGAGVVGSRTLSFGTRGEDVKQLQVLLNSKGYIVSGVGAGSKGKETTYFGNATRSAILRFQNANSLVPTGTLTSETYSRLVNSQTQSTPQATSLPIVTPSTYTPRTTQPTQPIQNNVVKLSTVVPTPVNTDVQGNQTAPRDTAPLAPVETTSISIEQDQSVISETIDRIKRGFISIFGKII